MDPQDQTFMTIHNLTPQATILFASLSVLDILGYQPYEIQGKSCFDYFHPEEVPFARSVHNRGVRLDKAAVLHYARIQARDGRWVSCECCFTIVHDVLVACTSIYLRGEKSERRALEAPQIRRIFSCSPRDPRYHMLEYLSPKFKMPPVEREPRAALILNRFTRNLSIMFATNAVSTILGLRPDEIKDTSFYECIQENCLQDAIRCLESAKANESIAYLRFWFRDPRVANAEDEDEDEEDEENDTEATTDSESGGAFLYDTMDIDSDASPFDPVDRNVHSRSAARPGLSSHTSSSFSDGAPSAVFPAQHRGHIYQAPGTSLASGSTMRPRDSPAPGPRRNRRRAGPEPLELEAVVSCTSDGLVVVLRKARPQIPSPHPPLLPAVNYENGLFAAPWGQNPIRPQLPPDLMYTFRPPLMPEHMPLRESVKEAGGPPPQELMSSIRDVAVFAWALCGINGNLATHSRGEPRDRAQPEFLPIWDPEANTMDWDGPENLSARRRGKLPVKDGQLHAPPSVHYNSTPAPHPLEPAPQLQSYTTTLQPLQPSGLDHYTYSGSTTTWPQHRQPSSHFGREVYEQSSYRPDPFRPAPPVLPPLAQPLQPVREPPSQVYEPTPSFGSSSQGTAIFHGQSHQTPAEASAPQTSRPASRPTSRHAPAPVPHNSSPTQGASVHTLRYLWQ